MDEIRYSVTKAPPASKAGGVWRSVTAYAAFDSR